MVSNEDLKTAAKYGGTFAAGALFDRYLLDPIIGRAKDYFNKRAEIQGRKNAEYTLEVLQKRGLVTTRQQFEERMYKALEKLIKKVEALEKRRS